MVSFMKDEFELRGLAIRKDLNSLKYSDISKTHNQVIAMIENQPIRTVIIRNWPDEDYLYSVFYRLNSGSLPLSSQELRKALHGGKLLDYIDDYIKASTPFTRIFGTIPDRRMRDVELVLRYVSFEQSYKEYAGNLKKFLDDSVTFYDTNWLSEKNTLDNHLSRLDIALTTALSVFDNDVFKKWNGDTYEKKTNRAVFDVITRFFADPNITELVITHKVAIIERFKEVCLDESFRDAIERTTKTPKAVNDRHSIWGRELAIIVGKHLDEENMRLI